jgi:CHAT domain-containing protein
MDLAVSSYTPTLRALIQLRQRQPAQEAARSGPLIVAMPETPGLKDLESTEEEAADIARRSPAYELLTGPSATCDAVAQAMPHHLWAHYACHGSQDLRQPFRGALHLHDGPLSITECDTALPAARFRRPGQGRSMASTYTASAVGDPSGVDIRFP